MLAALLVVWSTVSVAQIPSPRPTGWVTDQANVLDDAAEARLNAVVDRLHRDKGIELAVVTVDDVAGSPKQFATRLFNHWHIGDATTNTGVLVLLVMGQRRLEIETGTGIEAALPAAWLADMQAAHMVPRFKRGDFGGGLVAGVEQIAAHLAAAPAESTSDAPRGEYRDDGAVAAAPRPPPVEPERAPSTVMSSPDDGAPSTAAVLLASGVGALGVGGVVTALALRRRRLRFCDRCKPDRRMIELSEVEDDARLDGGQRREEELGSVDYEVLICPGCQFSRTLRHNKWFSGFSRCSACSYKTLRRWSTTLVEATYDHGGQVEVSEACRHCDHRSTHIRYTSQLTRSDSSSSSSGSSWSSSSSSSSSSGFGGGSSSGGGAGSSW